MSSNTLLPLQNDEYEHQFTTPDAIADHRLRRRESDEQEPPEKRLPVKILERLVVAKSVAENEFCGQATVIDDTGILDYRVSSSVCGSKIGRRSSVVGCWSPVLGPDSPDGPTIPTVLKEGDAHPELGAQVRAQASST